MPILSNVAEVATIAITYSERPHGDTWFTVPDNGYPSTFGVVRTGVHVPGAMARHRSLLH